MELFRTNTYNRSGEKMKRFSVVATPTKFSEVFTRGLSVHKMHESLLAMHNFGSGYAFSSGATSLYVLLKALKLEYKVKKVILPVYTATAVLFPILKAGLKPVFCDVSEDSFNSEIDDLKLRIDGDDCVVIPTHMFGLALKDSDKLKDKITNAFVVEDICQGQGTLYNDTAVGSFADAALLSFNRGKNIPAFGGGAFMITDKKLDAAIEEAIDDINFTLPTFKSKLILAVKNILLSFIVNPTIYKLVSPLISFLRERPSPQNFFVGLFTGYQAAVVNKTLKRLGPLSEARYENGKHLIKALSVCDQLKLPELTENSRAAFNRMPIIVDDRELLERLEKQLDKADFENSRMYKQPLHLMFPELGYKEGDFPRAEYFASHLLTVPCHPLMKEKDIDRMIDVIKGAL